MIEIKMKEILVFASYNNLIIFPIFRAKKNARKIRDETVTRISTEIKINLKNRETKSPIMKQKSRENSRNVNCKSRSATMTPVKHFQSPSELTNLEINYFQPSSNRDEWRTVAS